MTEEEAKTKWCPQAVASHTNPRQGFDGEPGRLPIFPCIGSACAWWRWIPVGIVRWEGNTAILQYPDPKPTEGYCGPAGKP